MQCIGQNLPNANGKELCFLCIDKLFSEHQTVLKY